MKRTVKILSILLAVAMMMVMLAACGNSTSGDEKTDVQQTETSTPSEADSYPEEPIRVIVPFAAGGGGDTLARTIEPYWAEELNGNFSVENMGGSGTQIGMTEIFNAGADPYVVGVISQPHTSLTIDVQDAPYTLDDFQCINLHNVDPQSVFVMQSFADKNGIKTINDLFDYMKANPGVSIGVNGMTGGHLFAAYMNTELDLGGTIVPYGGGAEARTALMGGIIDVMIMNEAASLGLEGGICLASNWYESKLWDAPVMSEAYPELAEVGIACANFKFVGCNAQLKAEHPEIFDKLVETYKAAYLNEEHLKICEGQGLLDWMKWYGPDESQKLWYGIQEISEKYSYLFK